MRRRQSCLLDPKETVLDNYTELFWMQLSFRLLIYLGAQILIIADNKYMYNLLSAVISAYTERLHTTSSSTRISCAVHN